MSKAIKRQAHINLTETSVSKTAKFYDLNLITKDISMLESFYDFIDGEDDVINSYLSSHDFNDFLNYFKSYHLYKSAEFALVFKVCAEILMRMAGDLNEKHSLIGQNFADLFMDTYKALIHEYLRFNASKSAVKSCIKFVTGLILQGSDVALKIATSFGLFEPSFSKQLFVRSAQDDDVHTCVINCFASFFVLGSNVVIRKLCEYKSFFALILRDLRFDKYDNVQLIIEILHEKIIKNSAISKTIKAKLFNVTNLHYLIAAYDWKGESLNFDEFKRRSDIDDRSGSVRTQLHQLMLDICSHNVGIAFTDNVCGQTSSYSANRSLEKLTTSMAMNDFFTHPLKDELIKTILRACPDIVPIFIEYLATLMEKIAPTHRGDIVKVVTTCYELIDNDKVDAILSESLNYMNGDKFVDVALLICAPTKTLVTIIKTMDKEQCGEQMSELRASLMNNCERVLTWIRVSEMFESADQRLRIEAEFREKLNESANSCGWSEEYKALFLKDLSDISMFAKIKKEVSNKETDMDKDEYDFNADIDEEISESLEVLNRANMADDKVDDCEALKKCLKHFYASPFVCIGVLKVIAETLSKGNVSLKKKQKSKLFDSVTSSDVVTKHWIVPQSGDEDIVKKELIRNYIFDIIVACVDGSNKLMLSFYEKIHLTKLLSVYGGTMSHIDQRIFYLLSIHQLYDTPVMVPDIVLFGNVVNEHYKFESNHHAVLWRPIIASQCINLLIDERMSATINHFPIDRQSPITATNTIQLDQSQRTIYDPCFMLEWLSQLLAKNCQGQCFVLDESVELRVLFAKRIIHFLVACQSSKSAKIRLVSHMLLAKIVDGFENETNEFPMKMQIQMILYHLFNSLESHKSSSKDRLPSVFVNVYIRMLNLLNSPDKKMFSPLWEMIITKESFDLKYVPEFLFMMYSDKEDYRTRQLWCLQLCADSIKDFDDFRVLINTKVLMNVTSLFSMLDQCAKNVVLTLIRRCVAIPQVAQTLRNSAGFVAWLQSTMHNKRERENRQCLSEIIDIFLQSLAGSASSTTSLEAVLRMSQ